jgi:RimJ/RimL family protein N-acetyltransferase
MVFDHLSKISEENDGLGCWVGHKGDEFVGWWVLAPAEATGDSNDTERRDSTASTISTTSSANGRVELGMRVAPKFQGQGFAKEGLQTLLKHSFEDLGAEEVYGETMAVNEGSRATMARCGLKHVRTWHNKYEDFTPPEGIEEGEVEYRVTKAEWKD